MKAENELVVGRARFTDGNLVLVRSASNDIWVWMSPSDALQLAASLKAEAEAILQERAHSGG
jgi:hypothetical protein